MFSPCVGKRYANEIATVEREPSLATSVVVEQQQAVIKRTCEYPACQCEQGGCSPTCCFEVSSSTREVKRVDTTTPVLDLAERAASAAAALERQDTVVAGRSCNWPACLCEQGGCSPNCCYEGNSNAKEAKRVDATNPVLDLAERAATVAAVLERQELIASQGCMYPTCQCAAGGCAASCCYMGTAVTKRFHGLALTDAAKDGIGRVGESGAEMDRAADDVEHVGHGTA